MNKNEAAVDWNEFFRPFRKLLMAAILLFDPIKILDIPDKFSAFWYKAEKRPVNQGEQSSISDSDDKDWDNGDWVFA